MPPFWLVAKFSPLGWYPAQAPSPAATPVHAPKFPREEGEKLSWQPHWRYWTPALLTAISYTRKSEKVEFLACQTPVVFPGVRVNS